MNYINGERGLGATLAYGKALSESKKSKKVKTDEEPLVVEETPKAVNNDTKLNLSEAEAAKLGELKARFETNLTERRKVTFQEVKCG